jgi:HK97 family phage major capsid protein
MGQTVMVHSSNTLKECEMSFDESRLRELQGALNQKMADNKAIADAFQIEDGTVHVSTDQKAAFDSNMRDIKELRSLIDGLESMKSVSEWGTETLDESVAAMVDAGHEFARSMGAKSLGQLFLDSEEFKSLQGGRNGANMPSPFVVNRADLTSGRYGQKDVFSALPTGTPGSFGTIERDAIVTSPMRTRRVRDLFPTRTTTAAVIEYFRMIGFTVPGTTANNNASTVAERSGGAFGLKPQSSMVFEGHQAPVRTLAHWEAAHRNVLSDEPQLRSIIDNELLYGLRLQEDQQILNGDGTGENLLGILNTSGVQNYAWSDGNTQPVPDTKADAIRRAATLAFLAYYEPTGVVLHPNDWEDIELTKDTNGQYLVAVSVALGGEPRIWRMPVVDTPAIDEGTALVGAFGTGAQLYDREQASIRISEQHADFFVRNAIVVLAEERLALAVKRPESFVAVDFDAEPE